MYLRSPHSSALKFWASAQFTVEHHLNHTFVAFYLVICCGTCYPSIRLHLNTIRRFYSKRTTSYHIMMRCNCNCVSALIRSFVLLKQVHCKSEIVVQLWVRQQRQQGSRAGVYAVLSLTNSGANHSELKNMNVQTCLWCHSKVFLGDANKWEALQLSVPVMECNN